MRAATRRWSGSSCSQSGTCSDGVGSSVPGRDDAERHLAFQGRPAPLVPTGVEASGVGVAPLGGHMVGSVARTQAEPDQERSVGLVAAQLAHPGDRLVGQILTQVVALVGRAGRVDVGVVADQLRRPMVGVAAEEPVVALEALAQRPVLERTRRGALVAWGEVPLADREGGVALVAQDLGERAGLVGDAGRVAGEVHRQVGQHADADAVVVATGEQAGARRRAHRGRVEVGEAHPPVGQLVDRRGGDVGAVAAQLCEADVVEHDHHHVGRAGTVRGRGTSRGRPCGGQLDLHTVTQRAESHVIGHPRGTSFEQPSLVPPTQKVPSGTLPNSVEGSSHGQARARPPSTGIGRRGRCVLEAGGTSEHPGDRVRRGPAGDRTRDRAIMSRLL